MHRTLIVCRDCAEVLDTDAEPVAAGPTHRARCSGRRPHQETQHP